MHSSARYNLPFQSTLSVRRATHILALNTTFGSISIHALRKESDVVRIHVPVSKAISIHALRKESDSRHQNRPQ